MHEYRQKMPIPVATQEKDKDLVCTIDSLAAHFGIMDIEQPNPSSHGGMTVNDEYRSYVKEDLWVKTSDPLKFWEVSKFT